MDVHVNSYVTECWLCGGHFDSYNYKVLTGADGPAAHVSVDPGDLLCTMSTQRCFFPSVLLEYCSKQIKVPVSVRTSV